jgi:hypothetical protein
MLAGGNSSPVEAVDKVPLVTIAVWLPAACSSQSLFLCPMALKRGACSTSNNPRRPICVLKWVPEPMWNSKNSPGARLEGAHGARR